LLATVSASRLGTWLGCRLKFYFRHVAGIAKPTTPARHVGSVVHAVLQQWSLARWRRAPLAGEMVNAVFEQSWTATNEDEKIKWDDDEPETAAKTAALALVQMYLRDTPIPPDEKPEAVEVMVEKDLSSRGLPTLVGVLDLVRAGGRIVDFKTTAKTPNTEMALHTKL
jgi:putative RecB family exonuclease